MLIQTAEHLNNLGHYIGQQTGHDQNRHRGQQQRIEQRQANFLAHLLTRLGVIGQPLKDDIEMPGLFASGHCGPVQFREYRGKIAQSGCQGMPFQYPGAHRQ